VIRDIEESACLGIQQNNLFTLRIEYGHSTRQGVQYLAHRKSHALGFRYAGCESTIAFLELLSQRGYLIVQLPV